MPRNATWTPRCCSPTLQVMPIEWTPARTSCARPPISAERTTLASATTATGSEIVEDLLLAGALWLGELCADLLGKSQEHFAAHLDGHLRACPRANRSRRGRRRG